MRVGPWSMITFPSAVTSFVFWLYVTLSARILMSWYSTRTSPVKIEYSSFCASTTPPLPTVMFTSPPPGFGPGMNLNFGRSWEYARVAASRKRQSAILRIRERILTAIVLLRAHRAIDARHVLQLHAQLDHFELIEPRDFFRAAALLALAQRDLVSDAHELAMRSLVMPSAASDPSQRMRGDPHVLVVDHAESGFVTQLAADHGPLLEHRRDDDERNDRRDVDRDDALAQRQRCRQPRAEDCDDHRDRVDADLPRLVAHVREAERDAVARDRAGEDALREAEQRVVFLKRKRNRGARAGHRAEDHPVGGLTLAAHEPDVQRGDREDDADRDRVAEKPDQAAGDHAGDHRHTRVASEPAVERFEIRRGRERGDERGDENESQDVVGHSGKIRKQKAEGRKWERNGARHPEPRRRRRISQPQAFAF